MAKNVVLDDTLRSIKRSIVSQGGSVLMVAMVNDELLVQAGGNEMHMISSVSALLRNVFDNLDDKRKKEAAQVLKTAFDNLTI